MAIQVKFFPVFLFSVIVFEFQAVVLQAPVLFLASPFDCFFLDSFSSTELHQVNFWCCLVHEVDDMGTGG